MAEPTGSPVIREHNGVEEAAQKVVIGLELCGHGKLEEFKVLGAAVYGHI